jgi:hypothetical protein
LLSLRVKTTQIQVIDILPPRVLLVLALLVLVVVSLILLLFLLLYDSTFNLYMYIISIESCVFFCSQSH